MPKIIDDNGACRYCGRPLNDVPKLGCGSEEFEPWLVNSLCDIYSTEIEKARVRDKHHQDAKRAIL